MNKKAEEQAFLNSFIELCPEIITKSQLIKDDPPDAEIEIGDNKISLEISRLFNLNGEKTIQEYFLIEEFKSKLIELSITLNISNVFVTWEFDFPVDVRGKKKQNLIKNMVQVVSNLSEDLLESQEFYHEFDSFEIPKGVRSMTVSRNKYINNVFWNHEKQWMFGELKEDDLASKVNDKNAIALKGYHKNFDQNWLLLVIEDEPHSSFAGFKTEGYIKLSEWVFDRIYIMEPKWNKVLYLIK